MQLKMFYFVNTTNIQGAMKRICIVIQVLLSLHFSIGYGQTVLFSEGFESGEIPLNWSEEFSKGAISWRFENGGYSLNPDIPNSRKPIAAHTGVYNALFQFQSSQSEATKLVTKKISALEFAVKPELHFYHAQFDWKHGNDYYHDYLRVYYKSKSSSNWTLLRSYTDATTGWVERIILLPENDLSADYYLAFEGETKWGWGACVDDIQILETGIKQKALSDISVEQASAVPISSGSSNNPILKINLKVTGNSGTCPINSLTLKSLNTADGDIETGGVKLFLTRDAEFNADNQVGSGVSFAAGQAVFNSLNYDLPTGYSYLWVTYDIKSDAGHRDIVDAKLAANSININGQHYFSSEKSPAGSRTILRTLHSDDFESGSNWTLSGEFEYGNPQGMGGSQGNPDPVQAYSGTHIIGTDLTGLGDYAGDYEKNLGPVEYSAVSETFDFTYYNDLSLRYMRYLNIGINDEASIDISSDGGKTWKQAWFNSSMILDDGWKLHEVDITALAARKKNVRVRYGIGKTNDYWQLSGWNIDDFSVTGNYVSKDVGISRVVSPVEGCGNTASESVTVMVKNYGALDSYGVIPLQYSFDGNRTIEKDTVKQVIPFGDSIQFTFKKKVNLSVADIYDLITSTSMNGDDDRSNDGISKTFYAQPSLATDYTENFESKGGLWMPYSTKSANWELGTPGFGIVPTSGTNLWMTRLVSDYPNDDSSFVESVCYRNNDQTRKILSLKYWLKSETNKDGACVQYSTNNGLNWQLLDTIITGWDWYSNSVQALNSRGWSGNSQGWITAKQILPKAITNASTMKFRLAFASDPDSSDIGFAFDDFGIMTAPPDIGVSQIDSFADRCQYLNPDRVTVTIRNFGINRLKKNDPIIVGFDFNQVPMEKDTFHLAADLLPGQTVKHTFIKPVDDLAPGDYNLRAYTLIEADPYFYQGNNDTLSLNFKVLPNPITMLLDTISTREPDTVTIRPFYNPDYDYLWNDMSTNRNYDVEHSGWYKVKVTATRSNGCISYDSSYVRLLFNDTGVDSLIYPYNHCGLGNMEYLQVRVRNFGTDSIPAGQKIAVTYKLNAGLPFTDTLTLANTFYAGHTVNYAFTKAPVNLSSKGSYDFRIYSTFSGDTIHANDTLLKNIQIYGHPNVNIGPDLTVKALSYTLDAGTGYAGYLWDNGNTGRTRQVTESGSFWVRVSDANHCYNADTAKIYLKIRDIRPDGLTNPVSDCRFTTGEAVSLRVMNSGTDTVPAGQHISVSYILNKGARIDESFDLAVQLTPGKSTTHTFAGSVNLNDTADYEFTIIATMDNDIRKTNDTSDLVIYRYPKPVTDFGLDDIVTIQGIEFPVDAGYSPYYAYQWQDGFDEHLYNATRSGIYRVKVSDKRTSCYDGDTVTVFLIYTDIGVISTDLPAEGCTGEFSKVKVRIGNMGTSNIGKDVPIFVACDVNGERIALDTLVRTGNFVTNSSLYLVLSAPVTIRESDTSKVTFYTLYGADMKPWNDTLTSAFYALPSPEIDFGDVHGVLQVNLPHLLDAGPGHKSYLWQDGSINQSYMVTENGTYTVTVTGQNDCQTQYTVQINLATGYGNQLLDNGSVIIYPNPGNGLFNISIHDEEWKNLNIQVINNQGQIVVATQLSTSPGVPASLDVQQLPRGLYHIIIQDEGRVFRGKMIIQ
jgi:hypothetical protein